MTITKRDRLRQVLASYPVMSEQSIYMQLVMDGNAHADDANAHTQYLQDAPIDGRQYVRQDGAWVEVAAAGVIAVGGFYFNLTGVDPAIELGYGVWTLVGTLHIFIP